MTTDLSTPSASADEPENNRRIEKRLTGGPQVFVSYRTDDSSESVAALAGRLRGDIGSRNVFRDKDNLIAGQPWAAALDDAIDSSDAVLVVMGPTWAGQLGDGTRRIDNPGDPVRKEVERALASSGPSTLPVLLDGDDPPVLPSSLESLLDRHFVRADSGSLIDPLDASYQHILVGVWESLRVRHPNGVLIIGDNHAHGSLDRLVAELQHAKAIDASDLSRFAAGACIVTARRARRGAKQWPEVIFVVEGDEPSQVLKARIRAALDSGLIGRIAIVGSGALALTAFLGQAGAGGATAATAIQTHATAAQLASSLPSAGTGLTGSAAAAWSSATTGVKVAVVTGAAATISVVAPIVLPDPDAEIAFADSESLAPQSEDDREYPLGEPGEVTVLLGDPVAASDTGQFSSEDASNFVTREVSLVVDGDAVVIGDVTLPEAVSQEWVDRQGDRQVLVGEVSADAPAVVASLPSASYCYDTQDPNRVVGGWRLTGADAVARVLFVVALEDGAIIDTLTSAQVEGPARRELTMALDDGFDLTRCPEQIDEVVWWVS